MDLALNNLQKLICHKPKHPFFVRVLPTLEGILSLTTRRDILEIPFLHTYPVLVLSLIISIKQPQLLFSSIPPQSFAPSILSLGGVLCVKAIFEEKMNLNSLSELSYE